jgi:hypothetical protein
MLGLIAIEIEMDPAGKGEALYCLWVRYPSFGHELNHPETVAPAKSPAMCPDETPCNATIPRLSALDHSLKTKGNCLIGEMGPKSRPSVSDRPAVADHPY